MTICHLCSTPLDAGIIVGTTGRHGDEFTTIACATCGLVQTSPLPSDEELAAYYAGPYRATFRREPVRGPDGTMHEWGSPEAEALMDEGARQYAAEIVATLGLSGGAYALEVGCGDGRLAAALSHLAGGRLCVDAIEADAGMVHEAQRRCVPVWRSTLADFEAEAPYYSGRQEQYDALVSCHVLEHFREPLTALRQMRSLLRPGGSVWLEVPNTSRPYGDIDRHFWQKPHLYNFTAATLTLTLLRAGFDDVQVVEQGHVLLAWATSGAHDELSYEQAAAIMTRAWRRPVQTGAEVAAMLDDYRLRYADRMRQDRAAEMLRRFRAGEDVPMPALRDAVELLGSQSHVAATMATKAIADGAAILALLDGEIEAAEQWNADPYWLGFWAGQATAARRASDALGHMLNALKLLEVEGTR